MVEISRLHADGAIDENMGLLTVIRKQKLKDRELRVLLLYVCDYIHL